MMRAEEIFIPAAEMVVMAQRSRPGLGGAPERKLQLVHPLVQIVHELLMGAQVIIVHGQGCLKRLDLHSGIPLSDTQGVFTRGQSSSDLGPQVCFNYLPSKYLERFFAGRCPIR